MIAVFTKTERDFAELRFTPKSMFKRIRSYKDVVGFDFEAVIEIHHWFEGGYEITNAYEHLINRKPELLS